MISNIKGKYSENPCVYCGKLCNKGVSYHNADEIMFKNIGLNESIHIECYIKKIIDEHLNFRGEKLLTEVTANIDKYRKEIENEK